MIPAVTIDSVTEVTEGDDAEVIADVSDALSSSALEQWLWALGIFVVAVVLSRFARSALTGAVERTGSNSFLSDLLGRLLGYVVVAFGTVYALEQVGVEVTPLLGALGLLGIALAFALQSILENFVAGVLLQVRRPFRKGDEIESENYVGTISSIDARTMTIVTPEGETVRLPNAEVIRNPIVNLTEVGRRRSTVPVGVAYGTDLELATTVALDAVKHLDGILAEPGPKVVPTGFGDSSIDLGVIVWHGPTIADRVAVTGDVVMAIAAAFEEHDISIPFPQRTLQFAATPPSSGDVPGCTGQRSSTDA